jgi:hypothetical protein
MAGDIVDGGRAAFAANDFFLQIPSEAVFALG